MTNKILPCVIGLGYVGLPVFVRLNKKFQTIGFDTNSRRVNLLKKKRDINKEINNKNLKLLNSSSITSNINEIKKSNFFIITVPTPLKKNNIPDLKYLEDAFKYIYKFLKQDDIIIVESTVYPGATKQLAKKILEKNNNMRVEKNFYMGYSPERINPGDKHHQIENTDKILAIETKNKNIKNKILKVYKSITKKITLSSSIEDAETAKVIENIQRDLNIALMNDIFLFCNRMNLNYKNIIKLASTKWNFLKFNAGLVGGHCLPVDPYYLSYIAKKNNTTLDTVLAGRKVNSKIKNFIYEKIKKKIVNFEKKNKKNYKVLISGITYKKNVADIRNSYPLEIYLNLRKKYRSVHAFDKYCDVYNKKKYKVLSKLNKKLDYNLVVFLVEHKNNKNLYKSVLKQKIEYYDPFGFYT